MIEGDTAQESPTWDAAFLETDTTCPSAPTTSQSMLNDEGGNLLSENTLFKEEESSRAEYLNVSFSLKSGRKRMMR